VSDEAEGHEPGSEPDRGFFSRFERALEPGISAVRAVEQRVVTPAWRSVTGGESRVPVTLAVSATIALQLALPARVAGHPRWLFPAAAAVVLVVLVLVNPLRVDRESPLLRGVGFVLIVVMSAGNAASAARLIIDLLEGEGIHDATRLLLTGGGIWLTNVVVFALWYWELDRGGPAARARGTLPYPDFVFPQMASPELAPPEWEPGFVDYFYVSFTNATAFSPTDTMPMSAWAKLTMMAQSGISLGTLALVIARAVNILR
jgi:hypothetical protein